MSWANVETVARIVASFNAGDLVAASELFHADAQWRDLSHAPDTPEDLVGIKAILAVADQWGQAFDQFGAEVYEYIDAHPWVVCDTRWHGEGRGSAVGVEIHQADAYELKGGKVARAVLAYADTATALAAVSGASSTTAQENLEVVRDFYAAWARGELPTEILDPEVEYVNPVGALEEGTRRGHRAFREAVEKVLEGWATWQMQPQQLTAVGTRVAVVVQYRARGRTSGVELEGRESALFTLRNGRVARYEWFRDPSDAISAADSKPVAE